MDGAVALAEVEGTGGAGVLWCDDDVDERGASVVDALSEVAGKLMIACTLGATASPKFLT